MGAYVGEEAELTARSWENPLGFFERRDARTICDALLHGSGADWWKVSSFHPDNASYTTVTEQTRAIVKLVDELDRHGTWVLKEPRLCVLLPIFQRALRSPTVVHTFRNPLKVARSLRRRNGFPLRAGLALWEAYNLAALRHGDALPRVFLDYDNLIVDPERTLERLVSELRALEVDGLDAQAGVNAIDSRLQRETTDSEHFDWLLTSEQRALWDALVERTPERIPRTLGQQAVATLSEFEADEADRRRLRSERDTMSKDLRAVQQKISALEQEQSKNTDRLTDVQARLSEAERSNRDLVTQLQADEKERKRLAAELAREQQQRKATDAALSAHLEKREADEKERRRLEVELAREQEERKAAETTLSEHKARIRKLSDSLKAETKRRSVLAEVARANASEVNALRASTSWRITRPLRFASHHFKHTFTRGRSGLADLWLVATGRAGTVRTKRRLRHDVAILASSPLFDAQWYLHRYPDVAEARMDPLEHYVTFGAAEGRDPGPRFSTKWYLTQYPDVRNEGFNPLVHFILHGHREDREPLPPQRAAVEDVDDELAFLRESGLFDEAWYRSAYPDVRKSGMDPAEHYLKHGARELRDPSRTFSTRRYVNANPTVLKSGLNPLVHFLRNRRAKDGSAASVADTTAWWEPLLLDAAGRDAAPPLGISRALHRIAAARQALPTIVVPVFNAASALESCLDSLVTHTPRDCRIIVIDDASTDRRVDAVLQRHTDAGSIELHRNDENLGYTRTANKGIELANGADVILLNSDTKVTPNWWRSLRLAAYSDDKIGTATPLSNNAGAFSAPEIGQTNEIPIWLSLDEYARAINQASLRLHPKTPTGNGFCMYIRRDCIEQTGLFDADAFPRGYGEENDFCMRAARLGWRHIVDDATFIYHERSASFGDSKHELMKRGRAVLDSRYPDYTDAVRGFTTSADLRAAQRRVREVAFALQADKRWVKPRVLFVVSTRTGGTPKTNEDLMAALDDRIEAFVLRSDSRTVTLSRFEDGAYVELQQHDLKERLNAFPHRSDEYDEVVAEWLVRWAIELVHVRHVAWHGLGLIDTAKALGLPVVFSFHDFYTICPTVKLLDENNVFCAGKCTATAGECSHELWPKTGFPPLKRAAISEWQSQMHDVLQRCDVYITTSPSAKKVLESRYPFLTDRPFRILPHGRTFETMGSHAASLRPGEKLRILIPGNVSAAKGGLVIAELAETAKERDCEIHLLGTVASDAGIGDGVIRHGAYSREDFLAKAHSIKPHLGGVFSIWPETYCHTLTELWSSGIPVIGFDFGAVGERIRETGAGWLCNTPTAESVWEIVDRLRDNPKEFEQKLAAVAAWQRSTAMIEDETRMSHRYFDIYRALLNNLALPDGDSARPHVAMLAPRAGIRNHLFVAGRPSTFVRLVGKTVDSVRRAVRYDAFDPGWSPRLLATQNDVVLVQRTALIDRSFDPIHPISIDRLGNVKRFIEACADHDLPFVFEMDDDLLSLSDLSKATDEYFQVRKPIEQLLQHAALVIVSTEALRERISRFNSNVVVEPNTLSARLWLAPISTDRESPTSPRDRSRDVRAIYVGTRSHGADLELLHEAVRQVRNTLPGFRLFVAGVTETTSDWYETIPVPIANRAYPNFVRWVRGVLSTMDFGVAPLVDTPTNEAKSDLKFLEYSAAKIACVASNVRPYRESIRDGETGLLVDNSSEAWTERLLFASAHPERCAQMADQAYSEIVTRRISRDHEARFDAHFLAIANHWGRQTRLQNV
jgi:GT2 family glycosyltransferase/glycosyltransferase involved in cell wall biosynthesis